MIHNIGVRCSSARATPRRSSEDPRGLLQVIKLQPCRRRVRGRARRYRRPEFVVVPRPHWRVSRPAGGVPSTGAIGASGPDGNPRPRGNTLDGSDELGKDRERPSGGGSVRVTTRLLGSMAACCLALLTGACSSSEAPAPAVTAAPTVPAAPVAPAGAAVPCYVGPGYNDKVDLTIPLKADGHPDFQDAWSQQAHSCNTTFFKAPESQVEQSAYRTAGYSGGSVGTLYNICTANEPDDVYAQPGFRASASQVPEINGALELCPSHPHAAAWKKSVGAGEQDIDLQSAGRTFGPGTFLVGSEIKPGRYFSEGALTGCYWARQNSSGGIIDNNFVNSARRVEVTISASDYAFDSKSCGQWRPIG